MPHAIRIHQTGGPEVMLWEEVTVADPGPGEARIRHTAVGVNFVDCYQRAGRYMNQPPLPAGVGNEGAGVITALGAGVTDLKVGQRVSYCMAPVGAYAEERVLPANRLVPLPDGISDEVAAAATLKGLTAQYLLRQTYKVQGGDHILFHAAAGGVGQIACQWASHLGCHVIGTVGSDEKAAIAKANGVEFAVNYAREDFQARTKEITGGKMVPVVYDSVGKDTFMKSLDCLRPLGMMVSFGASSGAIPPVDLSILATKGSLFVTRPTLATYGADRATLLTMAAELWGVIQSGAVKVAVNHHYPLKDAAQAHRDLEGRKTTGSIVLTV
jgi:NADPH2:quinone reductase